MGNEIRITEGDIRAKTTEKSFTRGVEYYNWDMVEWVTQRGNRLFAEVQGNEWMSPYNICVTLNDDDFTAACTCPYDWGGYCKHIVATLLTFTRNNEDVEFRSPIEDMLSSLNSTDLKAIIIRMVECDPSMANVIDSFCE